MLYQLFSCLKSLPRVRWQADAPAPDRWVPVLWRRPAINSYRVPFCCTTVRTAAWCVWRRSRWAVSWAWWFLRLESGCQWLDPGIIGNCSVTLAPAIRHYSFTCAPPDGWCIMMRALGSEWRIPCAPAASSSEPMEAAWPTHQVAIGGFTYCIVS